MMPWDDELRGLSQRVRETFGENTWADAKYRALGVVSTAQPDDVDAPFAADAVFNEALKVECRRLLTQH